MATQSTPTWIMEEPNVSEHKVLQLMQQHGMTGRALAKKLKVDEAVVSRGLRSKTWRNGKISELARIFSVDPLVLTEQVSAVSGGQILERVCGKPQKAGFLMPQGCHLCMLKIEEKWNTYLVAPKGIAVNDGDFVLIETESKGKLVGQLKEDDASSTHWIIARGGGQRLTTVEKDDVTSMRLVISPLGGVWGQS